MTLSLASRIALVTGASRGIGYATAKALAAAGAHVIAVARTQGGLEELDDEIRSGGGHAATLVPLDLTDFEAIARLGASIHERHGKLDVLVGNAGIAGPSSPLGHIELKKWSEVINLNLTVNFQLIRCMEPLLRQSDAGRAVFLTSHTDVAPAYRGPYAASKAALESLAKGWAREVENTTPIRVNLFDPGPIRSKLRTAIMRGEDPETLPTPEQAVERLLPLCLPGWADTGKLVHGHGGPGN